MYVATQGAAPWPLLPSKLTLLSNHAHSTFLMKVRPLPLIHTSPCSLACYILSFANCYTYQTSICMLQAVDPDHQCSAAQQNLLVYSILHYKTNTYRTIQTSHPHTIIHIHTCPPHKGQANHTHNRCLAYQPDTPTYFAKHPSYTLTIFGQDTSNVMST